MAESYRERILRVFHDTECDDMGTPLFLPNGADRRRESVRFDAVRGLLGRRGGRMKKERKKVGKNERKTYFCE